MVWFVYGLPTDRPFGRESEVSTVVRLLREGQPVGLLGPRRIGKTSILLASLKASGLPYVLLSAEEFVRGERSFDLTEFLSAFVSRVTMAAYSRAGLRLRLEERARGYLRLLRDLIGAIKVTFDIPEVTATIELVLDKGERGRDLSGDLAQVLDLPQVLAERLGLRLVIAIDEFQYLRYARQAAPEVLHVMRSRWQFHRSVSYAISGSAVGMLSEMVGSRDQPFYQFFYMIRVKPFDRETSIRFLKEGFRAEGVSVNEADVERIVDYVDGLPAWLNLVGIKVVSERRGVEEVLSSLPSDVNVVTAIEDDLRKLSPSARAALRRLAELGGEGSPRDLGGSPWAAQRALGQLIRYGYVERTGRGTYRVVDPMVVHYLARR